jgi:hypothetical protein
LGKRQPPGGRDTREREEGNPLAHHTTPPNKHEEMTREQAEERRRKFGLIAFFGG